MLLLMQVHGAWPVVLPPRTADCHHLTLGVGRFDSAVNAVYYLVIITIECT